MIQGTMLQQFFLGFNFLVFVISRLNLMANSLKWRLGDCINVLIVTCKICTHIRDIYTEKEKWIGYNLLREKKSRGQTWLR
jgi:hypothetical protein